MSWVDVNLDRTSEFMESRDRFVSAPRSQVIHIAEMYCDTWATGKTLCSKRLGQKWNVSTEDQSSYSDKLSSYKPCITCFRRAYW